ncbi:unnamed protein product, partial [Dicrocoelium dendriticum]
MSPDLWASTVRLTNPRHSEEEKGDLPENLNTLSKHSGSPFSPSSYPLFHRSSWLYGSVASVQMADVLLLMMMMMRHSE